MKSLTFCCLNLAICALLFSCERAVDSDSVDVQINFPNLNKNSTQQFIQNLVSINLAPTETIEVATVDERNSFSSIIPESDAAYPVNCYFIAVSEETGIDDSFKTSYCGKLNADTNELSRDLQFGPFAGLIYLGGSTTASAVVRNIKAGDKRKFHILGIYAASEKSCSDVITNKIDKSQLSKPYYVGSSQSVSISAATTITINIDTVANNKNVYYDDCIISKAQTALPQAQMVTVGTSQFPYTYIASLAIKEASISSSNYLCEPIDVELKATDEKGRVVAAALNESKEFMISVSDASATQDLQTYFSEALCLADTNGNLYGNTSFKMFTNDSKTQRWVRMQNGHGDSFTYHVNALDASLESKQKQFTARKANAAIFYYVDYIVPKQIGFDTCYEGSAVLRDIEGHITKNNNSTTTLSAANFGSNIEFYNTKAGCAASTVGDRFTTKALAMNTSGFDFYFKWVNNAYNPDTEIPFALRIDSGGDTPMSLVAMSPKIFLSTDNSGSATTLTTSARIYSKPTLRAGSCSPIYVSLTIPNGNDYVNLLSYGLNLADLRWATTGTVRDPSGFAIYDDPNCAANIIYPVGSTVGPSLGSPVAITFGTSFYKMYVKTLVSFSGKRKMQLFYGTTPIGQVEFDITDQTR